LSIVRILRRDLSGFGYRLSGSMSGKSSYPTRISLVWSTASAANVGNVGFLQE
jgi:hypothetical protein